MKQKYKTSLWEILNVTNLKTVITGKVNHCPQPCFHLYGVIPHHCALTRCMSHNQDLKTSMCCPDIVVETHLLHENERRLVSWYHAANSFVLLKVTQCVTWQVWLGWKTGVVRSAVVLFPPTGNRDRKYAEGEREGDCGGVCMWKNIWCNLWIQNGVCPMWESLTWCVVGVVMFESRDFSCSVPFR